MQHGSTLLRMFTFPPIFHPKGISLKIRRQTQREYLSCLLNATTIVRENKKTFIKQLHSVVMFVALIYTHTQSGISKRPRTTTRGKKSEEVWNHSQEKSIAKLKKAHDSKCLSKWRNVRSTRFG